MPRARLLATACCCLALLASPSLAQSGGGGGSSGGSSGGASGGASGSTTGGMTGGGMSGTTGGTLSSPSAPNPNPGGFTPGVPMQGQAGTGGPLGPPTLGSGSTGGNAGAGDGRTGAQTGTSPGVNAPNRRAQTEGQLRNSGAAPSPEQDRQQLRELNDVSRQIAPTAPVPAPEAERSR
jgi:hypothetical protein